MKLPTCLAVALVLVAGCHPAPDVSGHWTADLGVTSDAKQAKDVLNALSGLLTLDFKPDKSFVFTPIVEGTYVQNGSTITMTPTKALGIVSIDPSNEKPIVATLSDDGSKLTISDSGNGGGRPTIFVRAKAKT